MQSMTTWMLEVVKRVVVHCPVRQESAGSMEANATFEELDPAMLKLMVGSTLSSRSSPLRIGSIALIAELILALTVGSFAHAADAPRPTFASEVSAPQESTVLPLLKAACGEGRRR